MNLTIRKCENMGDWYVIEREEHDGREWLEQTGPNSAALRCSSRFSDADVEGTSFEMLAIADAITARSGAHFKRCAVRATGEDVEFWSPRNSQTHGWCTIAEARALAEEIRATVVKPIAETEEV